MATDKQHVWSAIVIGLIVLVIALLLARRHYARTKDPQYLIVLDPSESSSSGCKSVRNIGHRILEEGRATKKSGLTVLATGDPYSADEPRLLGVSAIPVSNRVMEGRLLLAREREKFQADLEALCQAAKATKASPIFLGAKRGMEQLKTSGCDNASGCEMYVVTDGEENAEPQIQRALSDEKADALPLPEAIDNTGISVTMCGFADTVGTTNGNGQIRGLSKIRDGKRADRILAVWSHLFTHPELVKFAPYCTA